MAARRPASGRSTPHRKPSTKGQSGLFGDNGARSLSVPSSSLQYLTDLPIDILKIDRSFVQDPGSGDAGGIIVLEAIAAMGKGLGLALIAEGIEEQSELERLRRLGSMAGQGYLFAHPMTVDDALVLFDCRPVATR